MDKDTANEGLISTLSLLLNELTHVNWYAFLFCFFIIILHLFNNINLKAMLCPLERMCFLNDPLS